MSGTFSENRIFLIGLSGSGKSTVGPLLASILHFTFCDTDSLIENTLGQSIVEIFKDVGEIAFRKHENVAMREAAEKDNVVIACGGGAPTFLANQEILRFRFTYLTLLFHRFWMISMFVGHISGFGDLLSIKLIETEQIQRAKNSLRLYDTDSFKTWIWNLFVGHLRSYHDVWDTRRLEF